MGNQNSTTSPSVPENKKPIAPPVSHPNQRPISKPLDYNIGSTPIAPYNPYSLSYDENDRMFQGQAVNSYFQFNTVNHIPPAPSNISQMMNVDSRKIPVEVNKEEIFNRESNVSRTKWNKVQKPQINYTQLPNASVIHYPEDKEQLSNKRKTAVKSEFNNIQKSLDDEYRQYKGINLQQRQLLVAKNIPLSQIDPLHILPHQPSLTLDDLNKTYLKLRNIHHPDKGGSADTFIRIQNSMETIKWVYGNLTADKSYMELRNNYKEYTKHTEIEPEDKAYYANRFNLNKFNKAFEEYRYRDDLEENGYGSYMIESSQERDDIVVEKTIDKFTLNKFNKKFNDNKKSNNTQVVLYSVPQSLDASDSIEHAELGGIADKYTASIKSRVQYTDYMDAYTKENVLIDDTRYEKRYNKNYKKALKDYKTASLELTDEQQRAIEEDEENRKKREYTREQRLKEQNANYERYKQSMDNFLLK
jgi:hypothetical protein